MTKVNFGEYNRVLTGLNLELYNKASQLDTLKNKIKELEDIKKGIESDLLELCENKPFKVKGFEFKNIVRPGAVKYKDIPELKDVDLEIYRGNPISFWQLFKKF